MVGVSRRHLLSTVAPGHHRRRRPLRWIPPANIDLADFAVGLAALVADGTILESDAAYLITLEYVPPDGRDRHD